MQEKKWQENSLYFESLSPNDEKQSPESILFHYMVETIYTAAFFNLMLNTAVALQ